LEQLDSAFSLANIVNDKFASGNWDGVITIWDINNDYSCNADLFGHDGLIRALLYIERYNLLLSGSEHYIKVWNLFDNICVNTIEAGGLVLHTVKGWVFC
jgi:WD40 repeat protein